MGIFSLTQELAIDLGTANTLIIHNGRVVVEHGRVLGMDEEQTRVRAQQLVDGMLQKAE